MTVLWRVPVFFFFNKSAPLLISIVQLDNGRAATGILQIRDNGELIGFARGPRRRRLVPGAAGGRGRKGTHRYVATFVPDDPYNIVGSTEPAADHQEVAPTPQIRAERGHSRALSARSSVPGQRAAMRSR